MDKLFGFVIVREVVHRSSFGVKDCNENIIVVSVEGARYDWIREASDGLGAIINSARLIQILNKAKFLALLVEDDEFKHTVILVDGIQELA